MNPSNKKSHFNESQPNYHHFENSIRLNKFLSNAGFTSRRKADEYIKQGLIKVNGQKITELGTRINPSDIVLFKDKPVTFEKFEYVLLNKPKNYITTSHDPQNRKKAIDLVENASPLKLFPVGRLDRNTSGLLLFTNNGALANNLMHPSKQVEKIYTVKLNQPLTKDNKKALIQGIQLEDGPAYFDAISFLSNQNQRLLNVRLHSGRNRIIRRMFKSLGYHVENLERIVYAGLTKKRLPLGKWRKLNNHEIKKINNLHNQNQSLS